MLSSNTDSLQAVIHNLNFRIETATKESASHQTELAASTDHCAALEREADEAAELVKELRLEVSSLKNDIRDAALQRVDDAQRLEDFTVEIKALKTRLDKSERATKLLQQGLNVNIDTEQIERERNKSKALAKHTALAKKKVKECEKEVSKWKALYQRQVASKFSSTDSVPEVTCD
uniref:Uncharacterized protein n=1 Tax=Spongospora subterranea TaxID=70186 RepID=A0A0H5R4V5_9EUKA|eukprot:CRZ03134.1 hypothetical protein [Spongospora subterranea]